MKSGKLNTMAYRLLLIVSFLFSSAAVGGPTDVLAQSTKNKTKWPECYCTDRHGERRELGDIICLTVGGRSFMAKCVMAQNNPFWRDQNHGCLSSGLETKQSVVASLDSFINSAK